jgi:hypothetical protein
MNFVWFHVVIYSLCSKLVFVLAFSFYVYIQIMDDNESKHMCKTHTSIMV